MVDYKKELKALLETIGLPVYYEVFTREVKLPCITYLEINNSARESGDTKFYGDLSFQIKVWANNLSTITEKTIEIDNLLRKHGFNRTFSNEIYNDNVYQKITRYSAISFENI